MKSDTLTSNSNSNQPTTTKKNLQIEVLYLSQQRVHSFLCRFPHHRHRTPLLSSNLFCIFRRPKKKKIGLAERLWFSRLRCLDIRRYIYNIYIKKIPKKILESKGVSLNTVWVNILDIYARIKFPKQHFNSIKMNMCGAVNARCVTPCCPTKRMLAGTWCVYATFQFHRIHILMRKKCPERERESARTKNDKDFNLQPQNAVCAKWFYVRFFSHPVALFFHIQVQLVCLS